MRVRFHRSASAEAEAAIRWYGERVEGLGGDFRSELVACLERIVEAPLAWPTSDHDLRARRCLLWRFPYSIVYVLRPDDGVIVVAVAHAKRRPGYWQHLVNA